MNLFMLLMFLGMFMVFFFFLQMESKKKRTAPSRPLEAYDSSHFVFEEAWDRYQTNVSLRNVLPERNVELAQSHYDEFLHGLERRQWHCHLTQEMENPIDMALVKEFYANLYDLKDRSP